MSNISDLRVPICQGLTITPTISGVSKEAFIINTMLAVCFILILKLYWMIIFFGITLKLLQMVCKKDPLVLTIFLKDYVKQEDYYHEG